jgi:pimeloyl-ACP methyl ester carboxylesterase
MTNASALSPGPHLFTSAAKGITFEYIVHHPSPSPSPHPHPQNLVVIHPPAWGLGSEYLQTGLGELATTPSTPSGTGAPGATRRLLFFHPRGTNNSSLPPDPGTMMSSMPDLASDLEDLREHLGLDEFPALLGHSNGGAIVLGYAELYPLRVRKLCLLNHSLLGFADRQVRDVRVREDERYRDAWRVMGADPETDEEFTDMVSRIWPLYFFDTGFVERLRRDVGERVMSVECWRSVYGCDGALRNPRQMLDGLERVQAKTLILFGKDDLICGPAVAERSNEGIRDAILLGYDCCGHFPWIEKKEQTLADIAAFLDTGRVRSNMCI